MRIVVRRRFAIFGNLGVLPSSGSPRKGEWFAGAYQVEGLLGSGSMADVYAAIDSCGAPVALKILHTKAAREPSVSARFFREADIAARIQSKYVARVVASGQDGSGRLWIAFERLIGETLEQRLRRNVVLPVTGIPALISDVLCGLADAHGADVVHRDIKPSNLFIEHPLKDEEGERVRILDFGVSKASALDGEVTQTNLTEGGDTIGSHAYMAPEQVSAAAKVDARADLYALGVVIFQLLAGRVPFGGLLPLAILSLKTTCTAPTLQDVTNVVWPRALEDFVARALTRLPEDRWQSAGEALHAWNDVWEMHPESEFPTMEPPSSRIEQDEPTGAS